MNSEPYLVTIIIPVYNVSKYIARCASSLFEQTYPNIEYVFVDDCSPDDSISILMSVLERYPKRKDRVNVVKILRTAVSPQFVTLELNIVMVHFLCT